MVVPTWLEITLVAVSVVMFVATLIGVPVFLVKIPEDYFAREQKLSLATSVLRTVVGAAIVAMGIAMLVLPGQGILTVLVGLGVMDLKFKRWLIRKILRKEKVSKALTKLRKKYGRPPLLPPPSRREPVPPYA